MAYHNTLTLWLPRCQLILSTCGDRLSSLVNRFHGGPHVSACRMGLELCDPILFSLMSHDSSFFSFSLVCILDTLRHGVHRCSDEFSFI